MKRKNALPVVLICLGWLGVFYAVGVRYFDTGGEVVEVSRYDEVVFDRSVLKERQVFDQPLLRRHQRLFDLLERKDFASLNQILVGLQSEFEADFNKETQVAQAYRAFRIPKLAYEAVFNNWVRLFPQDYPAYLARFHYYDSMAWRYRGENKGAKVDKEKLVKFNYYLSKAQSDLYQALKINPNLLEAYKNLVLVEASLGRDKQKKIHYQKGLEICPACFELKSAYLQTLSPRWGGSYVQMQEFLKQNESFEKTNPKLKTLKGYVSYDKAKFKTIEKQYQESLREYQKTFYFGDHWRFYKEAARVCYFLDQWDQAHRYFEKALELNPLDVESYRYLGIILYQQKKFDQAAQLFQLVYELWPYDTSSLEQGNQYAHAFLVEGLQSFQNRDWTSALINYETAAKFDPAYVEIYYWQARTYLEKRQNKTALRYFKTAINLNPKHFDSYQGIDAVLAKSKAWHTIINHWTDYLKASPNDAKAYLERAVAYTHAGYKKSAIKDVRTACELGSEKACDYF